MYIFEKNSFVTPYSDELKSCFNFANEFDLLLMKKVHGQDAPRNLWTMNNKIKKESC